MKTYFLILVWISPYLLNAQESNPYNSVIPPNPDAASLAKYADFPVDLSSGVPQISIPLWNIQCGDISVPISLRYHASGIPVAETPSYVGLGWTLNAGGAITRTIRGIADDGMFRHPDNGAPQEIPGILTAGSYYALFPNYPDNHDENANPLKYMEAAAGKRDLEPDMFYYNFGQHTGKFVLDYNGGTHLIPRKNIDIEKIQASNPPKRIIKWIVTTDDGLRYHFEELEETLQDMKTEAWMPNGDNLRGSGAYNSHVTSEHHSAWFLTRIEMPNSSQYVAFEYDDITIENTYPVSETYKDYAGSSSMPPIYNGQDIYEETKTTATITGKRLRKIIAPDQTVEFKPGAYRHDLKGDRVLDEVLITNSNNEIRKRFKFSYNYFSANGMTTVGATANANTVANTSLRLSLKSIREYDKNGNSLPPYTFEHEKNVWLPDRLTSKAQDHWGYYNGEVENTSLIPYRTSLRNANAVFVENTGMLLNSIRNAFGDYMKAGSLVKIQYPTGGYSQFNYEANSRGHGTSQIWDRINAYSEVGACVYDKTKGTFQIDDVSNRAKIKIKITGNYSGSHGYCGSACNTSPIDPANPSTHIHLAIVGPNGPIMLAEETAINGTMGTIDVEEMRTLYNGTYTIKAVKKTQSGSFVEISGCDASPYNKIKFSVEGFQQKAYDGPMEVGGLRIKEKIDYDPVSKKSLYKRYEYQTAYIGNMPDYAHITSQENTRYENYTSSSISSLDNGGTGIMSYGKVTVIEGDDEIGLNGKTENLYTYIYSFANKPTYIDCNAFVNCSENKIPLQFSMPITNEFPFSPPISGAWGSGLLKSQYFYKYKDNGYSKIKEIQNTYKDDYWGRTDLYNPETDVLAAKFGTISTHSGGDEFGFGISKAAVQFYFIPSRNINLIKTIETDYDDDENPTISKVTEIEYDNFSPHVYPSRTTVTLSDGSKLIEQTLYPKDYTNTGNDFIGLMKENNIISKPVEKITYKLKGSSTLITGGTIFTYKDSDNLGSPDKVFKLQTQAPVSKSDFKLSSKTTKNALSYDEGTRTSFSLDGIDARYTDQPEIACDFYDGYGNPTQITTKDGVTTSYVWGYNSQYAIAKIENATYSQVEEALANYKIGIAYTPYLEALKNGMYLETFGSYKILNDANVRLLLEPLRTELPNALVTTYTYKPLVGMTSVTEFNGKTMYYDYDDFGRLKFIKDNDGSIIKYYEYNYMEQ